MKLLFRLKALLAAARTRIRWTIMEPIFIAACNGYTGKLKALLANGADPDQANTYARHEACVVLGNEVKFGANIWLTQYPTRRPARRAPKRVRRQNSDAMGP